MEFNVGDKVIFGAYGDFNNETEVWTITQKDKCDKFLGGIQYNLENDKGGSVVAFADEVKPAN